MKQELAGLLPRVSEIVCKAAGFILTEQNNFRRQDLQYKAFNNFSSYVDRKSEEILIKGLQDLIPGAGFITEENTLPELVRNLNWIIDPLDGTTNFVHGYPASAVTVALMEGKEILLGVTHILQENKTYYAAKGSGAWCGAQKLCVSQETLLSASLLIPGFPYNMGEFAERYFYLLQHLYSVSHGLRSSGSSAVDLVNVASGRADAYFEFNLYLWDIAAGILLVQEAGGTVTDFAGGNRHLEAYEILAAGKVYPVLLNEIYTRWNM